MRIGSGLLLVGLLVAKPASADIYKLTFSGTISSYSSVDRHFEPVDIPSAIGVGDSFSMIAKFDTDRYSVSPTFDADPSVNIYGGYLVSAHYQAGAFSFSTENLFSDYSTIQIWNDHYVSPSLPHVDSFSISGTHGVTGDSIPVDLGFGPINLAFSLGKFDFTGTARDNDLIDELPPLDLFDGQWGSFGFINSTTYLQGSYVLTNIQASLVKVSAVPETSTWMLMLVGFGLLGGGLRRQAQPRAVRLV